MLENGSLQVMPSNATPTDPGETPRAWQRMLSGRRLDLLDPSPEDIAIDDIAHGLARVARWNGQTEGAHAFSVAQHCLLVEDIAASITPGLGRSGRLAALLHDAPEYVIGDLISPFKAAIGFNYKALELRLLDAIHRRFGLPAPLEPNLASAIKQADRIAAFHEATRLARFGTEEAIRFFGKPVRLPEAVQACCENLSPMPAPEAQIAYLARFALLFETSEETGNHV
jgi:5'-deoxynucleotidase YfbR-like HD superfamily hydrolase